MKKSMLIIITAVTVIVGLIFLVFFQQDLLVIAQQESEYVVPYSKEIYFSLCYIHSVQKEPIRENFLARAGEENINFISLEFSGFGGGMPGGLEGELTRTESGYLLRPEEVRLPAYNFSVSSAEDKKLIIDGEKLQLKNLIAEDESRLMLESRRHSLLAYYVKMLLGDYTPLKMGD